MEKLTVNEYKDLTRSYFKCDFLHFYRADIESSFGMNVLDEILKHGYANQFGYILNDGAESEERLKNHFSRFKNRTDMQRKSPSTHRKYINTPIMDKYLPKQTRGYSIEHLQEVASQCTGKTDMAWRFQSEYKRALSLGVLNSLEFLTAEFLASQINESTTIEEAVKLFEPLIDKKIMKYLKKYI